MSDDEELRPFMRGPVSDGVRPHSNPVPLNAPKPFTVNPNYKPAVTSSTAPVSHVNTTAAPRPTVSQPPPVSHVNTSHIAAPAAAANRAPVPHVATRLTPSVPPQLLAHVSHIAPPASHAQRVVNVTYDPPQPPLPPPPQPPQYTAATNEGQTTAAAAASQWSNKCKWLSGFWTLFVVALLTTGVLVALYGTYWRPSTPFDASQLTLTGPRPWLVSQPTASGASDWTQGPLGNTWRLSTDPTLVTAQLTVDGSAVATAMGIGDVAPTHMLSLKGVSPALKLALDSQAWYVGPTTGSGFTVGTDPTLAAPLFTVATDGTATLTNELLFTAGYAAPTFTTRSAGSRLVLKQTVDGSHVDDAIGVEAAGTWFSVADSARNFKWYAGTTNVMSLTGTGSLTGATAITTSGVITGASLALSGAITGATAITASGVVIGASLALSGAITGATTITASGVITGASLALSGTITGATAITTNGTITGASLALAGTITGATDITATSIGINSVAYASLTNQGNTLLWGATFIGGIGGSYSSSSALLIASATQYGISVASSGTLTASSINSDVRAASGWGHAAGATYHSIHTYSSLGFNGAGTLPLVTGVTSALSLACHSTAVISTITVFAAFSAEATLTAPGSGTLIVTDYYGLRVLDPVNGGNSPQILTKYGVYVAPFNAMDNAVNQYGIYVGAPTGTVTGGNYAAIFMGTVGVNTATPAYMLDVSGSMRVTSTISANANLILGGSITGATTITASSSITSASLVLSGTITGATAITASGVITGASLVLSGTITGATTIAASSSITGASLVLSGSITGATTIGASGAITGASLVLSGSITGATTIAASSSVTAASLVLSGTITGATTIGASGAITGGSLVLSGTITGATTIGASGAITGASLVLSGSITGATTIAASSSVTAASLVLSGTITGATTLAVSTNAVIGQTGLNANAVLYLVGTKISPLVITSTSTGQTAYSIYLGSAPVIGTGLTYYDVYAFSAVTITAAQTATNVAGIFSKPSVAPVSGSAGIIDVYSVYAGGAFAPATGTTLSVGFYYGLYVFNPLNTGVGVANVDRKFGLYVNALTAVGTCTSQYGIYVNEPTGTASAGNFGAIIFGKVGFGTATPTALFQVEGTIASATNTIAAQTGIILKPTVSPTGTGTVDTAIGVSVTPSINKGSLTALNYVYGMFINTFAATTTWNTAMHVSAPTGGASNTAAFFFGNGGVGTALPFATVHIDSASDSTVPLLMLRNAAGGASTAISVLFSTSSNSGITGSSILVRRINSNYYHDFTISAGDMRFFMGGGSGTGYGFGTVTPVSVMHVVGTLTGVTSNLLANNAGITLNPTVAPAGSGTVDNSAAVYIIPAFTKGSITTYTQAVGLNIASFALASAKNVGLYIDVPTAGTTNYGAIIIGKVGINTATPTETLEVGGTLRVNGIASINTYLSNAALIIRSDSYGVASALRLWNGLPDVGCAQAIEFCITNSGNNVIGASIVATRQAAGGYFLDLTLNSGALWFTIKGSQGFGYGFGVATPLSILHVVGTLGITSNLLVNQAGITLNPTVAPGGSGTVDNSATVYIIPVFTKGSIATYTQANGLYIGTYALAAVTNYGLYATVPTAGTNNYGIGTSGRIVMDTAGGTISIKTGSNACAGTGAVMVSGAVTVSTTCATANSVISVMRTTAAGGTQGIPVITISAGTSFTITSVTTGGVNPNTAETSTYSWVIVQTT